MKISLIKTGTAEYDAMIELRMKVLLEPIGIPQSYINPEREKEDLLIGAFDNHQLIGCCILTRVDDETVQLRQMAVDTQHQKKGVGATILSFAENLAKERDYQKLMMHARDAVMDFYQKNGYEVFDAPFTEVGIGHHKMRKQLL